MGELNGEAQREFFSLKKSFEWLLIQLLVDMPLEAVDETNKVRILLTDILIR